MKKYLLLILTSVILLGSCQKDYLSWMQEIESIKAELANQKKLIEALQANANITGIETNGDSYTIKFSNGQSITLTNGKTPLVTIGDNGDWYINGEDTGCPSRGEDGIDGSDGNDGVTPSIEIIDGHWWINGKDTGIKAEGKNGSSAPYIITIIHDGSNIVFHFSDGTHLICPMTYTQNILWGKKYIAIGDSFTSGYFNSYVDKNGQSGKKSDAFDVEWNMYKTYPYLIGKRNHMQVTNIAKAGESLAWTSGDSFNLVDRYKEIPQGADYITFKYGINDNGANVPIGEVDSKDPKTFCGAWNIILEYVTTEFPNAKIGLIASNACTNEDYSLATAKMAKRWGLLCLDEEHDNDVPYFFKQYAKARDWGIPYSYTQSKNKQYNVSDTDGHPNLDAHEFESTIIEAFLRKL